MTHPIATDPMFSNDRMSPIPDTFHDDVVILGGGLCGLLLAHEVLRCSDRNVWVVEAPDDTTVAPPSQPDRIQPANWLRLIGSGDDWQFQTASQSKLAQRNLHWPRGRGLGGSGRINAMIWAAPHPLDTQSLIAAGLAPDNWTTAVELAIAIVRPESPSWLSDAAQTFLSCPTFGNPSIQLQPVSYERLNHRGRRWTAMDSIQQLHRSDPSLCIDRRLHVVRSLVQRVERCGRRIASVHLTGSSQQTVRVSVGSDVISCLGAVGSPRLLLESGLGGSEVGHNLHDHLVFPLIFRTRLPAMSAGPWTMSQMAAWQHLATGPITCNIAECGGWTSDGRWQLHVTPTDYLRYPNTTEPPSLTIGASLTRPQSRGWIDRSMIQPSYLSSDDDLQEMVRAIRWVRESVASAPWSDVILEEVIPGPRRTTDSQLAAAIARYAQTLYHPGGTCALGTVVDANFRVPGIENLRVVDASVLPLPTIGNPTAVLASLAGYTGRCVIECLS